MGNVERIRDYAEKLGGNKSKIAELTNKMDAQSSATKSWWIGNTGDTFRRAYCRKIKEISITQQQMVEIQGSLKTLASHVQNAEEERKRKQLEAQKSKKK